MARPTPSILALLAVAAMLPLGACGSSDAPGIPSARTSTSGSRASTPSATSTLLGVKAEIAAYIESQRKWVACMREHGQDLPDPDAYGRVTLDSIDKHRPAVRSALLACVDVSVAVPPDVAKLTRPVVTDAEKATRRAYAQCMQTHGAPDFPDLGPDGYYVDREWNQVSSGAARATRACDSIVAPPGAGPARG